MANRKASTKSTATSKQTEKAVTKELTAKQKARQEVLAKVVHLQVEENPKRAGSKARERFDLYKDGMSVQEFIKAGGTMGDIFHDQGHGFITLS